VEGNADTARVLRQLGKNANAMRSWLQTQAIAEHYSTKLSSGDRYVQERMRAMEEDPELVPILSDVKRNGLQAAMLHFNNEEMMLKFSQKMGGLPEDLKAALKRLDETPLTIHEAAKMGDANAVRQFLNRTKRLDSRDYKGITPLGYAVGANCIPVVKLLLDSRARADQVDASGNSGLHFAAGYGRTQLVEYFLKNGAAANLANTQLQTPLTLARLNGHEASIRVLQAHGAS